MTVGLKQGSVVTEIGPGGVLHSFFSTIAVRLEGGNWGSRFPAIMKTLYAGRLPAAQAGQARAELEEIRRELGRLKPDQMVWDAESPGARPPWDGPPAGRVDSMARYFTTSTGRDLLTELFDNIESLVEFGGTLNSVSYDGLPGR